VARVLLKKSRKRLFLPAAESGIHPVRRLEPSARCSGLWLNPATLPCVGWDADVDGADFGHMRRRGDQKALISVRDVARG